jgi:hypothetical protein
MNAPTQTTDKTGVEAIDCTDCGTPYIVDYDTNAVEPTDETNPFSTYLDDDQAGFNCGDCGAKVPA